jgi:hypothetical protein
MKQPEILTPEEACKKAIEISGDCLYESYCGDLCPLAKNIQKLLAEERKKWFESLKLEDSPKQDLCSGKFSCTQRLEGGCNPEQIRTMGFHCWWQQLKGER